PDEGWAKGNPSLQPEIGTSAEVGITSEVNRYFETGLTYYRNYYKDLIQWASDGSVWMPSNVSCALINGIEWENRFLLSEDIEINVGYTYQIAKDTDTHKFLIYQPEHKTDFSIKHHNVFGCAIALRGGWNGLRYDNASNTTKMDGFFTLGFSASRKLARGTTFYLNIDNALNKKYQSVLGYPMPGFDLTTGVKIEF
ncbi:MAG: TonB-dependent receptor, partial [Candidatus Paceibacterota bacterium]